MPVVWPADEGHFRSASHCLNPLSNARLRSFLCQFPCAAERLRMAKCSSCANCLPCHPKRFVPRQRSIREGFDEKKKTSMPPDFTIAFRGVEGHTGERWGGTPNTLRPSQVPAPLAKGLFVAPRATPAGWVATRSNTLNEVRCRLRPCRFSAETASDR